MAGIADTLGWGAAWKFAVTRKPFHRLVIQATARAVDDRREKLDESRANKIANSVGRMLSGKD